jgi:hypothetical protein
MSFTPFAPAATAAFPPGVAVLAPSGDATGTTDTDAILAAIAAFPGDLGTVLLGPGSWYWEPAQIVLNQGQGLRSFAGAGATFVNCVGTATGPMISLANAGTFTGGQYASPVGGLSLLGYSAGTGTMGIKASGIQGQRVSDLYIAGFPGGGIGLINASDVYAEQGSWKDIVLVQNGTSSGWQMLLHNSSFDYTIWEIWDVCLANVDGLRMENGAQMRGGRYELRGNFYGGTGSNMGAVIAIDRGNTSGTSYIDGSVFFGQVESAGSGVGHTTILMGSDNSTSQFTGMGTLKFVNQAINFQGYSNAGFVPFGFSGVIDDTILGTMSPGNSVARVGGSLRKVSGSLTSAPGGGDTIFFQDGDEISCQIASGTNAWAFEGTPTGKMSLTARINIAQPASGAPGTITWTGVIWPARTAPTLSAGNSDIDCIELAWLPDIAKYRGTVVGQNYG